MPWLLKNETADELIGLRKDLLLHSAEAQQAYAVAKESGKVVTGSDRVMKTSDDGVAEILVEGVLTREPLACAWFFGEKNTAYSNIIAALDAASADANVKSVLFRVDSPGGNVDGLFDTLAAIQAFGKPMSVIANQACSAAFAIAAAAGKIKATNPAASFGSVGVAASLRRDPAVVDLTSTEAPDKRPDVMTEEGRAVVVRHLDAIHDLFVEAIADGRGVKPETVNAEFGRGATLLAEEALKRGMIDSVVRPPSRKNANGRAAAGDDTGKIDAAASGEEKAMDLKQLKTQHTEAYEAAVEEGVQKERKRCAAHIKMAGTTGAVDVAHKAIASGASIHDDDVHADYMSAALNRRDRNARQEESDATGAAVDGATAPAISPTGDTGDKAAAIMLARRGKKLEAVHG